MSAEPMNATTFDKNHEDFSPSTQLFAVLYHMRAEKMNVMIRIFRVSPLFMVFVFYKKSSSTHEDIRLFAYGPASTLSRREDLCLQRVVHCNYVIPQIRLRLRLWSLGVYIVGHYQPRKRD